MATIQQYGGAPAACRAVVVGAVESTAIAIEEIAAHAGWTLPLIVTLAEDLSGRHSDFVNLAPLAARAGAKLLQVERGNDPHVIAAIAEARPDYIFVIGWSQLCGPDFLALTPEKVIGYHPAPIPRLRGRAPIPWTILLNEPISASTLFWVNEQADSGAILAQDFFHVAREETAQSLYDKHMVRLREMMRRSLDPLAKGTGQRLPQDETYATWATRRVPADGLIDWRMSADDIARLVRAVGRPYPGAFTQCRGKTLRIWSARNLGHDVRMHAMPAQVLSDGGREVVVQTGDGLLRLDEWELDGGGIPSNHALLGERRG